jgi:hypothetical protein
VGFNPFRPSRRSLADVALMVAALAITAAVVWWAAFSG